MIEPGKPRPPGPAVYFLTAAAISVLMWGWFLLEHFTDLRIVRLGQEARRESVPIAVPIATVPLAFIGATILWRRAVGIAENCVPVIATVKSVGGEVQGFRDVTFGYTFEGVEYSKKMSVVGAIAEKFEPGSPVEIIVDRRKPSRIMLN
ncbi:MAG: hypothetical protein N3A38_07105 [Planctomycetota bacterium]|nr:hypothetical protein [Planctomycetota bacterium]